MDRRRFLTGASAGIGAAALGAFVKPAPAPVAESVPEALAVYGRSPAMVALPDAKFLEGLRQRMSHIVYYGTDEMPTQYNGFIPRVECG